MSLRVWLPLDGSFRNLGPTSLDITNTNATVDTNGKIGSCYYFNGSAFLSAPSPNDIISVCFWLKANYSSTSSVAFADYKSKIAFGFYNTSQAIVSCNGYYIKTYNHSITNNAWTHIALVKANNDILLYINGELQTSRGSTNYFTHSTNTLMIGKRSTGSNINGYINDVRLYDHILSDAEVRELARGLVLHYKMDNIINGITDSSGYGHHGIINGSVAVGNESRRYNQSIQLDGVDDSITVPYNEICPDNIFTLNLWFKKNALGSKGYETLFGGPAGFELDTRQGTATTLSIYMASTRGQRNLITPIEFGHWYMITMVRNGTKEQYYVNGIFQSEINAKSMPTGVYRIGAWSTATKQNYYGLISDFRIYNTPLTADDVLELYRTSTKIDNKQNLHTFELVEDSSKISINNKGQTLCDELIEDTTTKFYKGTKIIKTNQLIEI